MTYFPKSVFRHILEFMPTTKPARDKCKIIADEIRYLNNQVGQTVYKNYRHPTDTFRKVSRHLDRRYTFMRFNERLEKSLQCIRLDGTQNGGAFYRAHSIIWKKYIKSIVELTAFVDGRLCVPVGSYNDPASIKIIQYATWYNYNYLKLYPTVTRYSNADACAFDRPETKCSRTISLSPLDIYKTVYDCKKFCRENGIKGYSKLKKAQLIQLILAFD